MLQIDRGGFLKASWAGIVINCIRNVTVSAPSCSILHVKPIAQGLTWQIFLSRLESSSTPNESAYELLLSYRPTRSDATALLAVPLLRMNNSACPGHNWPPQDPQQEACNPDTRSAFPPNACITFCSCTTLDNHDSRACKSV